MLNFESWLPILPVTDNFRWPRSNLTGSDKKIISEIALLIDIFGIFCFILFFFKDGSLNLGGHSWSVLCNLDGPDVNLSNYCPAVQRQRHACSFAENLLQWIYLFSCKGMFTPMEIEFGITSKESDFAWKVGTKSIFISLTFCFIKRDFVSRCYGLFTWYNCGCDLFFTINGLYGI